MYLQESINNDFIIHGQISNKRLKLYNLQWKENIDTAFFNEKI